MSNRRSVSQRYLFFTLVLQCRNSQSWKGESLDAERLGDKGWQWWLGESSDLSFCPPSVNWTLPYHRGRLNHKISLDSGFAPLALWLTKHYSLIFSAFQAYSLVCKVCAITHTDSSALLISQVSVTKATCKINCFITLQNLLGRQCWSEGCCRVLNGFIVHEVLSYHAANTDRGCLSDRAWWVKKEPFYVTFPRHSSACHSGTRRNTEIHQRSEQTFGCLLEKVSWICLDFYVLLQCHIIVIYRELKSFSKNKRKIKKKK